MQFWENAQVYIPKTTKGAPYRLSLTAKSSNPSTYLGVKNFVYTTDLSRCRNDVTTAKPTTTTTSTISPSKSLDCTFEDGTLCNWKSSNGWTTWSTGAFVVGSPTGQNNVDSMYLPYVDHTRASSTGHFAYTYSKSRSSENLKATLSADNPYQNQVICFRFYYYFYTSGSSTFFLTMDNDTAQIPVFRAYGANENKWRMAYFTIEPNATYSKFTFRSSIAKGKLTTFEIPIISTDFIIS